MKLHCSLGGPWRALEDSDYPFPFYWPVAEPETPPRFFLVGEEGAGGESPTPEATVGAPAEFAGNN